MASGLQAWSKVPANNANADSNVNWAEGMAPSAVNDSARSMMASAANWRDDNSGVLVTSGTTIAFTVATNQIEFALTAGYTVGVQFHATNDLSATLSVDNLAAAPMQTIPGTSIPYGAFQTGSIQRFTYSSTGTGQWIANSSITNSVPNPTFSVLASGTLQTYTPPIKATWLKVRMVGGGAGGSGANHSGSGVGAGTDTIFSSSTSTGSFSFIAGGGSASFPDGGAGGAVSGVIAPTLGFSGAGGQGSGTGTQYAPGGSGGCSPFGGNGSGGGQAPGGAAVANTGSGGGGGGMSNAASGAGGGGGGAGAYIETYITGLSTNTSYTYSVGAGGTAGTGAGGGYSGGAGATGLIVVEEHYAP